MYTWLGGLARLISGLDACRLTVLSRALSRTRQHRCDTWLARRGVVANSGAKLAWTMFVIDKSLMGQLFVTEGFARL